LATKAERIGLRADLAIGAARTVFEDVARASKAFAALRHALGNESEILPGLSDGLASQAGWLADCFAGSESPFVEAGRLDDWRSEIDEFERTVRLAMSPAGLRARYEALV
jgi:hypothetical protein